MEYHRTLDPKDERFESLVEPLTFDRYEVAEFKKKNVCATCQGRLTEAYIERDVFRLHCIDCGHDIYKHNYMSKAKADRMNSATAVGALEIRCEQIKNNPVKRSPEEILKELGF